MLLSDRYWARERQKEEKRNVLYQRYRESTFLFIFSFYGLLYFMPFGDLKEVRGGKFEVFYNDCIFMDLCWMALGLSVKTSREFMLSICGQKTSFCFSVLLRFPHLGYCWSVNCFCPLLCGVFCQQTSWGNIFLRHSFRWNRRNNSLFLIYL